jgi:hypothetical protein
LPCHGESIERWSLLTLMTSSRYELHKVFWRRLMPLRQWVAWDI